MRLRERLAEIIRQSGPMSVDAYMTHCLHDPQDGYYATRPAIGAGGDFITAPAISQMFGELIGLWAAECWSRLGCPARVILAEAGPGDGTLMSDVLRAARAAPDFLAAAEVWMVEVSPPLEALQRIRLGERPHWVRAVADLPGDAPLIFIANELLDCLPARQFLRTEAGWRERLVGLNDAGDLAFGLRAAELGLGIDAPPGTVMETAPSQQALAAELGGRLARQGGAALLIDYGRAEQGMGDTLQALKAHAKVDPLACPGEADLTVHADFPAVMAAAEAQGARAAIMTQSEFLGRLEIGVRADALCAARPDRADTIRRQLHRLTAADQMGDLFKACCLHSPGWTPPGFETP